MVREEISHYSQALDREMHMIIYGQGGLPFLCFPTQDSMCHNFEDFGMIDQLADFIDGGRLGIAAADEGDHLIHDVMEILLLPGGLPRLVSALR